MLKARGNGAIDPQVGGAALTGPGLIYSVWGVWTSWLPSGREGLMELVDERKRRDQSGPAVVERV